MHPPIHSNTPTLTFFSHIKKSKEIQRNPRNQEIQGIFIIKSKHLISDHSAYSRTMERSRSPRRRKGGTRQKVSAIDAEGAVPGTSTLVSLLLNLFAWGDMSAQLVQRVAQAAYEDAVAMKEMKTDLSDLKKCGKIGCAGFYQNKCYSDLMQTLPLEIHIPKPTLTRLPFKCGNLLQGFLLPHELFSCIYHFYPATWRRSVVPSDDRLEEFWQTNTHHPAMAEMKISQKLGYRRRCVPISMHGDDVPITGVGKTWCQLLTVFSWSAMTGLGNTKEGQFFVWGCWEKLRKISQNQKEDTLGLFFNILVWSLRWLQLGMWPDRDWHGTQPLGMIIDSVCFLFCSFDSKQVPFYGISQGIPTLLSEVFSHGNRVSLMVLQPMGGDGIYIYIPYHRML